MSHDQRPGRMRVVAQTRAASSQPVAVPPGTTAVATENKIAPAAGISAKLKLMLSGLFLIGCASGGVAIALLPGSGLFG